MTITDVPATTYDGEAPRPVVRPTTADAPVRIESIRRSDITFEADDDFLLKVDGVPESGAALVALNVDGEGFDSVTVEHQRDNEAQLVSATEALQETLGILRRLLRGAAMSARQVHPFRAYRHELSGNWATVKKDLGEAPRSAMYLWPLTWRVTADRDLETAERNAFELGRDYAEFHQRKGS